MVCDVRPHMPDCGDANPVLNHAPSVLPLLGRHRIRRFVGPPVRVSDAASLAVTHIQKQPMGHGLLTIRRSKADQDGRRNSVWASPVTMLRIKK